MKLSDKGILNSVVIIILTISTFTWTFLIFHIPINFEIVTVVLVVRILASYLILNDYSLSWSKASPKTFLIKSVVYISAFIVYAPLFYTKIELYFLVSELFVYLFSINFFMYIYYSFINRSRVTKTKSVVIFGAGRAGIKLEGEFLNSEYKVKYFLDDNEILQKRSIDSIKVISMKNLKDSSNNKKYDLLIIAIPSAKKERVKEIYEELNDYFSEIKILPSFNNILSSKDFKEQLANISVEDLLARNPQDLDKTKIAEFLYNKTILITGAGGSIGSEICMQCEIFGAKKLILVDNCEYNLYSVLELLSSIEVVPVMQSIVNKEAMSGTFDKYKPEIVIHAAAYKHVPLVESNIHEGIINNVFGTKNIIDISIEYDVEKFIMISTDKAVRPTNVMGTTKRICELYAQNSNSQGTDIVAVRFGNVLGSSGSVIPKFQAQIDSGENITVTHPDITRYFMLIPEACELVLQAGAIGSGGEIFILDMGEPIKIVDLAQKMIDLSGKENIQIEFSGLRPGEKLYEELLIDDTQAKTDYESITVAAPTEYNLDILNKDIEELICSKNQLQKLKEIVPEFNHQLN